MLPRIRQPLAVHALCAVAGVVWADLTESSLWPWALALAALLWSAWGVLKRRRALRAAAGFAGAGTVALFFAWYGYLSTEGPGARLARMVRDGGKVVQAVGIVDTEPEPDRRFQLRLESLAVTEGEPTPCSAPVLVRWNKGGPLRYGDRVEITGDLHLIPPPRNPGVFDGPGYWKTQGVTCELKVRYNGDVRVLEHDRGRPFVAHALALRHWMEGRLALDLEDSPQLVALIQSMVLGSQGDSMDETRRLFQYTGTMHLFAVSGMNVAMLAGIATFVLMALGLPRPAIAATVIPLLWVYCYATGLGPSSLRATVMATIFLGGLLVNRIALPWNTLGASALVLIAWTPGTLFTSGFQLSFLMVAFLFLFATPIQRRLTPWVEPDPFIPRRLWTDGQRLRAGAGKWALEGAVVSAIAWIGSTPLMIHYFHLWSPSTIPANIGAALLAWMMLVTGVASVIAGLIWNPLAIILNNANWLAAKVLLTFVGWMAALPGSHLFVESPSGQPTPLCEVEVLDLPGGAATHLRVNAPRDAQGRRDWLVDCGNADAVTFTVAPYLRSRGVNTLDGLVITHGDSRHIGGAGALMEELPVAEVIDSYLTDRSPTRKALHNALEQAGRGKGLIRRGDRLTLAPGVTLSVLFPPEGLEVARADDKALVLRLDAAGKRILFTSDAGFRTESWLLENGAPGECASDIWIKQTHAGDLSGIPEFVSAVSPSLIVASGAAFPAEERIKEDWAREVTRRGIRLLRQDEGGAVDIRLAPSGKWTAEALLTRSGSK